MRKTLVAGVMLAAGLLCGCISLKQYVKLNADGSAIVTVETWVDDLSELGEPEAGTAETAAAATAEPTPAVKPTPPAEPTVEDEMGPAFGGREGIEVVENWARREEKEDGTKVIHTKLIMNVDRLDRLSGIGCFENTTFTEGKKGKDLTFGEVVLNTQEKKEAASAESEELVRKMFEGYTFTYVLEMPGEVKAADGAIGEDKRTVTWSWPLYDFTRMDKVEMTATGKAK